MISLLWTHSTAITLENTEFYGFSFLDSIPTECQIQWLLDGRKLIGLRTWDRMTDYWQSFVTWRKRKPHTCPLKGLQWRKVLLKALTLNWFGFSSQWVHYVLKQCFLSFDLHNLFKICKFPGPNFCDLFKLFFYDVSITQLPLLFSQI
jgi:hypothetical protein